MKRVCLVVLVCFFLVNKSYSKLSIFIEGGNNKNIHSNKTVHFFKETQTALKGEFYTYCLISSCCQRISLGWVGFHLFKQVFSSSKAEVFGYRARRNSWQGPELILFPKIDTLIAFYSGLVCLGFFVVVVVVFSSYYSLPVNLIGINYNCL